MAALYAEPGPLRRGRAALRRRRSRCAARPSARAIPARSPASTTWRVSTQSQGRYGEAEPLYAQALALSREILGEGHPDTLVSLNNLASLYDNQGRYGEAEPLFVQALALRRETLGETHPQTLASLNNLAVLYVRQGRMPADVDGLFWATRIFAGPDQFPPEHYQAYGIVAFPVRAESEASTARQNAICRAWAAVLPSSELDREELPATDRQMVTVWPVATNEVAGELNMDKAPCDRAVSRYGLVRGQLALRNAAAAGWEVDDNGPYLLAWSPPSLIGSNEAVVLVADLSHVMTYEDAIDVFREWRLDIESDSALWNDDVGWNLDVLREKLRRWADRFGPQDSTPHK